MHRRAGEICSPRRARKARPTPQPPTAPNRLAGESLAGRIVNPSNPSPLRDTPLPTLPHFPSTLPPHPPLALPPFKIPHDIRTHNPPNVRILPARNVAQRHPGSLLLRDDVLQRPQTRLEVPLRVLIFVFLHRHAARRPAGPRGTRSGLGERRQPDAPRGIRLVVHRLLVCNAGKTLSGRRTTRHPADLRPRHVRPRRRRQSRELEVCRGPGPRGADQARECGRSMPRGLRRRVLPLPTRGTPRTVRLRPSTLACPYAPGWIKYTSFEGPACTSEPVG